MAIIYFDDDDGVKSPQECACSLKDFQVWSIHIYLEEVQAIKTGKFLV